MKYQDLFAMKNYKKKINLKVSSAAVVIDPLRVRVIFVSISTLYQYCKSTSIANQIHSLNCTYDEPMLYQFYKIKYSLQFLKDNT